MLISSKKIPEKKKKSERYMNFRTKGNIARATLLIDLTNRECMVLVYY